MRCDEARMGPKKWGKKNKKRSCMGLFFVQLTYLPTLRLQRKNNSISSGWCFPPTYLALCFPLQNASLG
ncbi:hypothetical protein I7I48_09066 [Histoplasma ohiense]|nr:hypothetical protein I7I48_09066 [Histoplasma ohiense (nom. inval.)]